MSGFYKFKLQGDSIWQLKSRILDETGIGLMGLNPEDLLPTYKLLAEFVQKSPEPKQIALENIEFIKSVVGSGLKLQRKPYLRILRPGNTEDSVGIHRDTHYGATNDEWVLWVPLTSAVNGGELGILPGSHLKSDEDYPWTQEPNPDVKQGSLKHWLGYMYAPKKMGKEVEGQCIPIPCKVGEAILFNAACVHGSKLNTSSWTRVSIDMRLADKNKPTSQHGIHGEFYEDL